MRGIYQLLNIETESKYLFDAWKPGEFTSVLFFRLVGPSCIIDNEKLEKHAQTNVQKFGMRVLKQLLCSPILC